VIGGSIVFFKNTIEKTLATRRRPHDHAPIAAPARKRAPASPMELTIHRPRVER
jgi:hypothetical protein